MTIVSTGSVLDSIWCVYSFVRRFHREAAFMAKGGVQLVCASEFKEQMGELSGRNKDRVAKY
jgi:hypothetical protein